MRGRLLVTVALSATLLGCGVATGIEAPERSGPYRGQVVDVETGQPLAGVVVSAVWWNHLFPSGVEFYDARETVTGADGRFEIPRLDIPLTKPGAGPPRLHFFAPGYLPPGYYPAAGDPPGGPYRIRYRVTPPEGQLFVAPTVVAMRRIRTPEEWCDYKHSSLATLGAPAAKIPRFGEAFRNEDRSRGACRYPSEPGRNP